MSGATRIQQIFLIELPAASRQIMVGVNQSLMAALSMVIIAAVIGGFNDVGWEVLLTMRKAQFGQSLLAGLVIVVFAILIDRLSARFADPALTSDKRTALAVAAVVFVVTLILARFLPPASEVRLLAPVAVSVDEALTVFTRTFGNGLDTIKNTAMFYALLPVRIGLDEAVLPFTWGFQWTGTMSLIFYAVMAVCTLGLAARGHRRSAVSLLVGALVIESGVTGLPWPFVILGTALLGWIASGQRLALFITLALGFILLSGLWERAMLSLYLCGISVITCVLLGGFLGWLGTINQTVWRVLQPICDMLQTIPLFVFLIPVLMIFQIGEFSAFLAICAYAIVPIIRYTRHGLTNTPADLLEAAISSGATTQQIMREVRLPWAAPAILVGVNQTILYAFSMLVIAALVGTTGLGQSIYLALGQADIGLGIAAGSAMALLALIADRIVQGFAKEQRRILGIT